jgi:hypothetical protein
MRCLACNCQLTDKEATRKYASSGEFLDLCDHCYGDVEEDIPTIEGNDPYGEDGEGDGEDEVD